MVIQKPLGPRRPSALFYHWWSRGLEIENRNCLADSSKDASPGSVLPANNSRDAPQPVETWPILSASPRWLTRVAV